MSHKSKLAHSDLITIRTFSNELEAHLAKGALEAFGIECMIAKDNCGGQRPHLDLIRGIRLMLRHDDAQRAAEVLSDRGT